MDAQYCSRIGAQQHSRWVLVMMLRLHSVDCSGDQLLLRASPSVSWVVSGMAEVKQGLCLG